jgi:hypothetical protein
MQGDLDLEERFGSWQRSSEVERLPYEEFFDLNTPKGRTARRCSKRYSI